MFAEMLKHEKAGHIVPDDPAGALNTLRGIYPKEKEDLDVYVFRLKVIKKATGNSPEHQKMTPVRYPSKGIGLFYIRKNPFLDSNQRNVLK